MAEQAETEVVNQFFGYFSEADASETTVEVYTQPQWIREYSNKDQQIIIEAEKKGTHEKVEIVKEGLVDRIEDRVKTASNPIRFAFNAYAMDRALVPEKAQQIFAKYIAYAKAHPTLYFDDNGDWAWEKVTGTTPDWVDQLNDEILAD